jgi:flagellar biosynthesis/type III secretory pathway M-ring protein FliF/YscJ
MSEVKANKTSDWLKRWGLWILLGLAALLVILCAVLPSNGSKPKLLQEAKDGAKKLKEKAEADLESVKKEMEEREKELAEIESIEDEAERLEKLAEFANRR